MFVCLSAKGISKQEWHSHQVSYENTFVWVSHAIQNARPNREKLTKRCGINFKSKLSWNVYSNNHESSTIAKVCSPCTIDESRVENGKGRRKTDEME